MSTGRTSARTNISTKRITGTKQTRGVCVRTEREVRRRMCLLFAYGQICSGVRMDTAQKRGRTLEVKPRLACLEGRKLPLPSDGFTFLLWQSGYFSLCACGFPGVLTHLPAYPPRHTLGVCTHAYAKIRTCAFRFLSPLVLGNAVRKERLWLSLCLSACISLPFRLWSSLL